MQAITQYLLKNGYTTVEDAYYSRISYWQKWYKGKVAAFHTYTQYNGKHKVKRTRKSLGMAKKFCEDWASLLLNEKVEINISDEIASKAIHDILERNRFRVRSNQLVELAFALGTGAFVEYMDGEDVIIDYVRAGMIYPLSWDNGDITDCAFASERKIGKERFIYLNIHERNESGLYVIKNLMFRVNGGGEGSITQAELPDGVLPEVNTNSEIPRFQIITPNIVNNADLDSPMGISVYANATDPLENIDTVFDAYNNEFNLGKKRIMVPITMARTMMEADGVTTPVFDDNDVEFYAYNVGERAEGQKIDEMNGTLRYEAFEAGLATAINLGAYKCGFGENKYRFKDGGVKTATEVVSEDSDLFRNLRKHELMLENALDALVRAISDMLGIKTAFDIDINFDDSIIEDANAERLRFMQEIRDGIRQKWEYRVKYLGETEEQARRMIAEGDSDELFDGGLGDE